MAWITQLTSEAREMIQEQLDYRELLYQMTKRDVVLRYKQTAMGFAWAIFTPLLNTAVFSVVFTRIVRVDTEGVPYPLFAYTGLLVWSFFASSLRFAVVSLSSNAVLVGKVYFPREIFPFSAVLVSIVDFLVASVLLIGMMLYYAVPVGSALLWLPVVFAVHVLFTLALALMLSMANLYYRDVKYLFELTITMWMFGTSVVYPVSLVGGRLAQVLALNPMTPIVDAYRGVLLHNTSPATPAFLAASVLAVVALVISWFLFHRTEFEFAENI